MFFFVFQVTVDGTEYQPSVASANKKQAKADAATVCLQKLGIIPWTVDCSSHFRKVVMKRKSCKLFNIILVS